LNLLGSTFFSVEKGSLLGNYFATLAGSVFKLMIFLIFVFEALLLISPFPKD